jgi:hypothetical protein
MYIGEKKGGRETGERKKKSQCGEKKKNEYQE